MQPLPLPFFFPGTWHFPTSPPPSGGFSSIIRVTPPCCLPSELSSPRSLSGERILKSDCLSRSLFSPSSTPILFFNRDREATVLLYRLFYLVFFLSSSSVLCSSRHNSPTTLFSTFFLDYHFFGLNDEEVFDYGLLPGYDPAIPDFMLSFPLSPRFLEGLPLLSTFPLVHFFPFGDPPPAFLRLGDVAGLARLNALPCPLI